MDRSDIISIQSFLFGLATGAIAAYNIIKWYTPSPAPVPTITTTNTDQLKKQHRRRLSNITIRPTVRAICFDLDGTLIKTEHLWYSLLKDASVYFNSPTPFVTLEEYPKFFGQSMQQNVEQFFPDVTVEQLDEFCGLYYNKYVHLIEVVPGAVEALKFATDVCGHHIYLTTNCPRHILNQIFSASAFSFIKDTFGDRIYCAGDPIPEDMHDILTPDQLVASAEESAATPVTAPVIQSKPSTQMIDIITKRTGVKPQEIMLVGDSIYDMQAIHAAGGIGIALHYPHIDLDLSITDIKINSLVEFYELQKLYKFQNPDLPEMPDPTV